MKVNIFRIILAVLILTIPLYPKFPLNSVTGTYVNIRLDDIVVGLATLIWIIYQIKNRFPFLKDQASFLILLYWFSLLISAAGAILIFKTDPTNLILLHTFRRFEYMSLFFIGLGAIKQKTDLRFIYIFTLIAVILTSAYGLGQKYFSLPVVSTMNEEFSKGQLLTISAWTRINSTFAGHYDLAVYMSVVLIIIYSQFIDTRSRVNKLFSFLVFLLGYYILTLTASRVSMAAFWLSACVCLSLLKRYVWILPTTVLVILSILNSRDLNQRLQATIPGLSGEFTAISKSVNNLTKKYFASTPSISPKTPTVTATPIISVVTAKATPTATIKVPIPTVARIRPAEEYPPVDVDAGVARSGEIRFKVEWPRAINAFKKNFLQGTGPASLGLATDNDFLRTLGESGLFGIVSFFLIFSWFIRKSIQNPTRLTIIFFSGLLCMLINAIFIDVFAASKTAYLFWIMMAVYRKSLEYKDES